MVESRSSRRFSSFDCGMNGVVTGAWGSGVVRDGSSSALMTAFYGDSRPWQARKVRVIPDREPERPMHFRPSPYSCDWRIVEKTRTSTCPSRSGFRDRSVFPSRIAQVSTAFVDLHLSRVISYFNQKGSVRPQPLPVEAMCCRLTKPGRSMCSGVFDQRFRRSIPPWLPANPVRKAQPF